MPPQVLLVDILSYYRIRLVSCTDAFRKAYGNETSYQMLRCILGWVPHFREIQYKVLKRVFHIIRHLVEISLLEDETVSTSSGRISGSCIFIFFSSTSPPSLSLCSNSLHSALRRSFTLEAAITASSSTVMVGAAAELCGANLPLLVSSGTSGSEVDTSVVEELVSFWSWAASSRARCRVLTMITQFSQYTCLTT